MSTITETPQWVDAVDQIDTTDAVLGGPDGVINVQAKQLADRTAYLKASGEATAGVALSAEGKADSALAQIAAAEAAAGGSADNAADALEHKNAAQAAQALSEQARDAAQAAQSQASNNAAFSATAAQTSQTRAAEAATSATTAVAAASASVAARDSFVAQSAGAAAAVSSLADAKVAEIEDLGAATLAPVVEARDATLSAAAEAAAQAGVAVAAAGAAGVALSEAEGSAAEAYADRVAAEAARDAAFVNAKGASTISAARALVADTETFIVYADNALKFDAYRRTSSSTEVFLGTYPSKAIVDSAMLSRVDIAVGPGCTFTFTAPNTIGWTTFRFFTPTAISDKSSPRRVPNRAAAQLAIGQCLYIDLALPDTTSDMVVVEATMTNALMGDFTSGKKLLLAHNYASNNFVGALTPYFLASQNNASAVSAQTSANTATQNAATAQTNSQAARRVLVGAITSVKFSGTSATVSISEGRAYKENNSGTHERVIAPLSNVVLSINQGIIVDLVSGAIDGSGRVIPTVGLVGSGVQAGMWQTANNYLLAVNSGVAVHGAYTRQTSEEIAIASRVLVTGAITKEEWAGASVTVTVSSGRAYKEANSGVVWKTIAPLENQTLADGECLIVDLDGAVNGSGQCVPVKLLIAQGSAAGWQTANKHIIAANANSVLVGSYTKIIPNTTTSSYEQSEVVVVQRSDEVDIYIKGSNPASSKYLRYRMQRKPNSSIISDVWRWNEVWECTRTGEYSFSADLMLAQNGENETAIREASKSAVTLGGAAYMGGPAHGNEELFSVSMLIDGAAVALGGTGNFRCRRVEFLQGSDLYEVDTTPARLNRRAKAYKRWDFSADSVVLHQSIVWEASVTLAQCFLTMLTWLRVNGAVQISDKGYRSIGYQEEDISTAGFTMVFDKASIAKASGPSGRSAEVEVITGWDKAGRTFNFSNAAAYNKFYFEFSGAYTTAIGEVFSISSIYRIDTRN